MALLGYLTGHFLTESVGLYLQNSVINFLPDFCIGMWMAAKKDDILNKRFVFLPFLTLYIVVNLALLEDPFVFGIAGKPFILSMVLLIFWLTYIVTSKVNVSTKILSLDSTVICVFLFHRLVWRFMLAIWNPHNFAVRFIYLAVLGVPCIFVLSKVLQHSYAKFLVRHGLTDLRGLKIFFRKACLL